MWRHFTLCIQGRQRKTTLENTWYVRLCVCSRTILWRRHAVTLYRRFPDNHFPGQTFPGQDVSRTSRFPDKTFPGKTFPGQDVSPIRRFPDNHFPGQTFPGQVILRNFHVHSVCKYQLYRPSHTICRYTERLLMCACRPAVSIRGLFGKACSPTMGKA